MKAIMMSMATSLDQILKNTSVQQSSQGGSRRRSLSAPPNDRDGREDRDPNDPKKIPSPDKFATGGLPAALADLIPGLAAATSKATKKSGEARSASDRIVRDVIWPHEKIRAENGQPLTATNVSQEQWTRGMVQLIEDAPQAEKGHMLHYLKEALLDIERSDWDTVRRFNTRIFHEFEGDRLSWADREGINMERLRFLYAATHVSKPKPQHQQTKTKPGLPRPTMESTPCRLYNEGACTNSAIQHDGVWHMCAFCKSVRGKAIPGHGANVCLAKQRLETAAKNAPSLLAGLQPKP